ncbi:MAG: LuxR C-terminal-related transcriptional regulator [Ktedonobacteraceae bacterium]
MQQVDTRAYFSSEMSSIMQEALSKRELEVLHYIAIGMSNQEIAQAIVITVGTVKRHTNHIYSKLNVRNRLQAVMYAQRHNILPSLCRG